MPTTVTSKGQVTIPKSVRDLMGLQPGSRVSFRRMPDGRIELVAEEQGRAPERPLAGLRGHAGKGLTTDEILAMTRGEN